MPVRHILRAQQFDMDLLKTIFRRADRFATWHEIPDMREREAVWERCHGKVQISLFYQPSTRTRISFGIAAHRLGIHVEQTENAREFSSAIKGESLEDTIRVLNAYEADLIVLRHYEEGAAQRAASVSSCPVINAGDGPGQHPTQALLDLYTIRQAHSTIDGLTVVIGGDLARGRTARSLAYLLSKYKDVNIIFVSPPELRMGSDVLDHLKEHGAIFAEHDALEDVVGNADVVYWTRAQTEHPIDGTDDKALQERYCIDERITRLMQPHASILHPLPRNSEISAAIDSDPRARYFIQAGNGVPVRMAAIEWVLGLL